MDKLLGILMRQLEKHEMIPEGEQEVYAYSLEVALGSASFWIMMAGLTAFWGELGPTVIYLSAFFFFAHCYWWVSCPNPWRCLAISAGVYVVFIGCYRYLAEQALWTVLFSGLAGILIFIFALIDHPNKPFSQSERSQYRRQSCYRAWIFCLFQIFVFLLGQISIAFYAAFGALQSAVFMLIAYSQ